MNIIILEDNEVYLEDNDAKIKKVCKSQKIKGSIKKFTSVDNLLEQYINNNVIDVAILDIEVGEKSGLEVAKAISVKNELCLIVFVTSYEKYLTEANKLLPFGYLEKPVDEEKISKLLCKAKMQELGYKIQSENKDLKLVDRRNKLITLQENEIIYAMRDKDYLKVVTEDEDGIMLAHYAVSNLECLSDLYVKVERGTIVNRNKVKKVKVGELVMENGDTINVSMRRYKEFLRKFEGWA